MRYVGKAKLDGYGGRFWFVVYLVSMFGAACAAVIATMGWMLILQAILNGGR